MKRFFKWLGLGVAALLVVVLIAAGVVYWLGGRSFSETHELEIAALDIPTDPAALAHGEHLSRILGCRDCHGEDLGGQMFMNHALIGYLGPSNLTSGRGGVGQDYDAVTLDRAIRHGLAADGRALLIMPSQFYTNLSDADTAALIAYLQAVPPSDHEWPAKQMGLLGRLALLTDESAVPPFRQIDHASPRLKDSPVPPAPEFGRYYAHMVCAACHGPDLHGGVFEGGKEAPDLLMVKAWDRDGFATLMRTGVSPTGRTVDTEAMPVEKVMRYLTDQEIDAIYGYLVTLQAKDDEAAGAAP